MRVAIVTGAAQGIGRAISLRLAMDGVDVAVNDLPSQQDGLEQLVKEIEKIGRKAMFVTGDVSKESDVQELVKKTVDVLGGLDIMVANAGIHKPASVLEVTDELFDKMINVNCKGVLYCYRAAAAQMIKQGRGGRIIGASSIWGTRGGSLNVAYVTSKFGVRAITQCAALEWGQYNITVNSYAPGLIDTPMVAEAAGGAPTEVLLDTVVAGVCIRRMGKPEEIAAVVSLLASEGASYITGGFS
ncbi:3-ketoacyl-(acyl-carrier) reductase [Ceratobasidium theobromae]|uniref:3-ketoacyl-(Acyl-carrier) reductase n=1 Tax=Ceratobasidium theobromae TaxID=1582974 RepID=A0A5N5QL62_9AGAM|nr:3-ketoacyl-(acyl-carrier) reductase [Ceratobasidium theobromae]